ncbi:hypothetical protein AYO47_00990 [Planctomyces sp. SCGC AG-212-M04]|nr:hypothetical protein AYO47_00990 [Planctomyces sp. SCGC AG-212-M04]
MSRVALAVLSFVLCVSGLAVGEERSSPATPRLGMNLSGIADWSTELPFANVFHCSRPWISQKKGQAWGTGPALEIDERGWVKRLEPDCWAETVLLTVNGHYPHGKYTVLYDGKGTLEPAQAGKLVERAPGRLIVDVDPKNGGDSFFLRLKETDPADPVKNIRVLMPGVSEEAEKANPWNPAFLKLWQGMACIRFMDQMDTNNSKVKTWDDRPRVDDATFSKHGVPVELLCDLANRLGSDAWFCMPHMADDDHVRRFAEVVRNRVDPKRKVYIEYSNEVWNGGFGQHRYAAEKGKDLKLAEKDWEAAWRYTALRSMEVFKIWEEVFGGRDRLVRVLPSQAANPYISEQITGFRDAARHADALAIAPYLSFIIGPKSKPPADEVATWTVDQVLDHIETKSLPESTKWIAAHKKIADKHGLALIAYEGGQHLVGIQGAENNDTLTKLFHAANAHPRMGQIYDRYFEAWEKEGGGLFAYFSSVGNWSKWGSWGLIQNLDEDPEKSPKWQATMRWGKKVGQAGK